MANSKLANSQPTLVLFEKVSASAAKRIAARHIEDLRLINNAADELNSEVADVLEYQVLGHAQSIE